MESSPAANTNTLSEDVKTEEVKKPKVKKDFKPSAVRFGMDALGLIRTGTTSGFHHLEGQADIDFHHYFFVVDFGHERNVLAREGFNYTNQGAFFRVGVQFDLMPYNVDKNVFFVGFRYAKSNFSDHLVYTDSFDKWGEKSYNTEQRGLTARWYEMNMGMKVKVFENVYFGYTLRYKISKKMNGFTDQEPYLIPGYGRASKASSAGFNYYILYNIPFRDKPVGKKPVKKYRERQPNSTNQQNRNTGTGGFSQGRNFGR